MWRLLLLSCGWWRLCWRCALRCWRGATLVLVLVLVLHRPAYQEERTRLERDYAQLVARQQVIKWHQFSIFSLSLSRYLCRQVHVFISVSLPVSSL